MLRQRSVLAALATSALLVACCSGFISRLIYPDPAGSSAFEGPNLVIRGFFRVGLAIFVGLLAGIALILFRRRRANDTVGTRDAGLILVTLLVAGPLGGVFGYFFVDVFFFFCEDACRVF